MYLLIKSVKINMFSNFTPFQHYFNILKIKNNNQKEKDFKIIIKIQNGKQKIQNRIKYNEIKPK